MKKPGVRLSSLEVSRRRDGSVHSISVTQSDPKGLGRVWVQDVECLLLAGKTERRLPLQLSELASELLVPDDVKRLDCFLVNGRGFGYGYFTLDPNSGTFLLEKLPSIPNVMVRAVAWTALWEEMLEGQVAAEDLTELALNVIASEENELLTHRLLSGSIDTLVALSVRGEKTGGGASPGGSVMETNPAERPPFPAFLFLQRLSFPGDNTTGNSPVGIGFGMRKVESRE